MAVDMTRILGALDARTERKLARQAAKAAAERAERAEREDEKRRRRAAKRDERRRTQAARAQRRTDQGAALAANARRLRPAAPLLAVTGFAVYGQIGYGFEHYSAPGTPFLLRMFVAIGAAVAVESIALTVQWHAHDALLHKATATAARLRRASYLIAGGVAGVNYAHFADGWRPTAGAVVFALFSASSPWLWGLHTRRAQRLQLLREGQVDSAGAVFSVERFRAFPWRTWMARRWSIDHGISHPRIAWESYRVERQRRRAAYASQRVARDRGVYAWVTRRLFGTPVVSIAPQTFDVPELEQHTDIVIPDPTQVDDNGLSLRWKTAAAATESTPDDAVALALGPDGQPQARQVAPESEAPAATSRPRARRPARNGRQPSKATPPALANPPQAAIGLVRNGVGRKRLREELLDEHGIEIGEYEARELIKRYRPEVTR